MTTATPAVANYDAGPIPAESLVSGILERDEIHSYSFSVAASSAISVTAVAMPDADVIVSVYNVDGDLIGEQNSAPAGDRHLRHSRWRVQLPGCQLPVNARSRINFDLTA